MRGTLAEEAREKMNDARAAADALRADEPSDEDKVAAYQIATVAVFDAAARRQDHVVVAYRDFTTLRYVGAQLVAQGIKVTFNFDAINLTARWG